MKKIIIYILIFFLFCITFSFYKIKKIENSNNVLNKKISILEKKDNGYKNESIFYKNGYLQIETDFFKNYEKNLLNFKNYLKEIDNICKSKKVCVDLLELDINFSNNNDVDKFLNDFSLKNVYKLRISIINTNEEGIKNFFKNLNYQKLKILHLDIEQIQGEKLVGYIKDFINTKKDINLLQTFTIENIGKNKLSDIDILNLSKLKVENIVFLGYPISLKEVLSILKNSKYLNKIIVADGINYNGKKAFYFIKRNGKIHFYNNIGNKLN